LNILTKICAVVLLILVLVASVVFINMATVPQNYRQLYEEQRLKAQINGQDTRLQKLVTNRLMEENNALKSERGALLTQIAELNQRLVPDPPSILVKKLMEQNEAANTMLAKLQLAVKAAGDRNDLLAKQLEDERVKIAALQEQIGRNITELTQEVGKRERAERVVRALERQLQDREERIKELETQVAGGAASGAIAAVSPGMVTATITAVRGDHASINVGVAQGVALKQKLYIYRNASFVGYLRIDEVDEAQAAGTIVDKQLDPAIGDKVTNDLLK
jgi:predicted Holliday junction resolvase-like endonuclease